MRVTMGAWANEVIHDSLCSDNDHDRPVYMHSTACQPDLLCHVVTVAELCVDRCACPAF